MNQTTIIIILSITAFIFLALYLITAILYTKYKGIIDKLLDEYNKTLFIKDTHISMLENTNCFVNVYCLRQLIDYNWKDEMVNFMESYNVCLTSDMDLKFWINWSETIGFKQGASKHIFYHLMVLKQKLDNGKS